MPATQDDFFAEKHSIINELFIAPADDNYVLARWCFHQHLNVDFYWLARAVGDQRSVQAALRCEERTAASMKRIPRKPCSTVGTCSESGSGSRPSSRAAICSARSA
jgi:hypothetical protein